MDRVSSALALQEHSWQAIMRDGCDRAGGIEGRKVAIRARVRCERDAQGGAGSIASRPRARAAPGMKLPSGLGSAGPSASLTSEEGRGPSNRRRKERLEPSSKRSHLKARAVAWEKAIFTCQEKKGGEPNVVPAVTGACSVQGVLSQFPPE